MSQDAGAADTGAAYVFAYENGSWGQQAKLTADTGASGDQFGFFVGLSGSYAVVGAPQDDDAGSNGRFYLYFCSWRLGCYFRRMRRVRTAAISPR